MAEVEALLYSQIYYENESSDNEKIQLSFNGIYNDIKCDVDSKSGGMKTPGGDSGCGTSRPNSRLSEKLSDNRNLVGGDGNHSPVNDVIEESKYLESYNVVSNPFFDAANSDTESDDGIIILPRREGTPPEIICIDSDSNSSIFKPSPGVVVSDQESINKLKEYVKDEYFDTESIKDDFKRHEDKYPVELESRNSYFEPVNHGRNNCMQLMHAYIQLYRATK